MAIKDIRLYKIRASIEKLGRDLLYLVNIPSLISVYTTHAYPRKNQIMTAEALAKNNSYLYYQRIRPLQEINIVFHKHLNDASPKEFKRSNLVFPETFICKINNTQVISDGIVVTDKHQIISSFFNEMGRELIHHQIFTKWSLPPVVDIIEVTAVLVDKQSNCYFHWIFDVLPRLIMLQDNKLKIDKYLFYSLEQSFQKDTLDMLKIDKNKIIQATKTSNFKISEAIIPSLSGISGVVPADSCQVIRTRLLDTSITKDPKYKKIYISRSKAKSRKILNETYLAKILERSGFLIINMEDYSIQQQIQIAHSADIIISSHGSGLTNIVFCEPGTKIFEIFSANFINTCYQNIAYHCHLDYNYYIINTRKFNSDDINVNVKEFASFLDKMLTM